MDAEPRSKRWRARWRRRRKAALAAAALPVFAALVAVYLVPPTHRATATLRIEGRSSPPGVDEAAARAEAVAHVDELRRSVEAQVASRGNRPVVRVDDVVVRTESDGRSVVSIEFAVVAQDSDARVAERVATQLVEQYVTTARDAASMPVGVRPELEEARLAAARLAAEIGAIEGELEEFRLANGSVLGGAVEQHGAAPAPAQAERLQIERQIAELEARRIELDRGLREMQATADPRVQTAVSSEALTALQTKWAILRGREGRDSAPAAEVAEKIRQVRSESDGRLTAAAKELEDARTELARLERLHTIEYPDVVAQAHKLSAMESRFGGLRVRGLTDTDVAYIESLARERREIDGRIEEVRARHAGVVAIVAEHEQRAAMAPLLQQQNLALEQQLATARSSHEGVRERQASLEAELAELRAQLPGRLSVVRLPRVDRAPLTRSAVILALGGALAVFAASLSVALREFLDKRVAGAASIRRVLGSAALVVEIPIISVVVGGRRGPPAEQAAA